MSRSLDDLDHRMKPLANAFLANAKSVGLDLLVTCTLRGMDEQAALYAQGRTTKGRIVTNAKPGTSAHNYGLAMDVVPIVNGKPYWNFTRKDPIWSKVGQIGMAAGLEWLGAPGSKFVEGAHFEMPNWKELI